MAEFKKKIVAFIDILGFTNLVYQAEASEGITLQELLSAVACLKGSNVGDQIMKDGPAVCPSSPRNNDKLDYKVTQFSDSVVISCEATPLGAVNLAHHCFFIVFQMLRKNMLCRGYVTVGNVYHSEGCVIGSAYMEAIAKERYVKAFSKNEKDSGVPFVEVDATVVDLVAASGDKCIKDVFGRCVFGDGQLHAIYPFSRMLDICTFGISSDIEVDKRNLDLIRKDLAAFVRKAATYVDVENESAYKKFAYYCDALNQEISRCNELEKEIELLNAPYPWHMITSKQK